MLIQNDSILHWNQSEDIFKKCTISLFKRGSFGNLSVLKTNNKSFRKSCLFKPCNPEETLWSYSQRRAFKNLYLQFLYFLCVKMYEFPPQNKNK